VAIVAAGNDNQIFAAVDLRFGLRARQQRKRCAGRGQSGNGNGS